ncbi:MAG: hypothetical protein JW822_00425 [Spirochaetales bacterium]|nr:hypothetical protein [Spirochaetales bacterium]
MKKLLFLLIIVAALISCDDLGQCYDNNQNNPQDEFDSGTSYADLNELNRIAEDTDTYVDWRIARVFALINKEEFGDINGWNDTQLSERPVIIYDYNVNPEYYEFRVIKNGTEIGAIACVAQKKDGEPVKYVIPFVRDDTRVNTKARNIKIIDSGYPSNVSYNLVASMGNLSREIDPETGVAVGSNIESEVPVLDFLRNTDQKTLEKLGIDSLEKYDELMQQALERQAEIDEFWNIIEEAKEEIINVTDEDIKAAALLNKQYTTRASEYWLVLYNWYDKRYWWNPGGWCATNCLSFISIGADCYPGWSGGYPGINNADAIKAVYDTFYAELGKGPDVWEDIKPALSKHTTYTLSLSNKSHNWDQVNSKMKTYHAPAMSLRTTAIINGTIKWAFHYRVVMGLYKNTYNATVYLFGIIPIGTVTLTDKWYLMHDNGSDGGASWFELAGSIAQFESVSAKKK